MKDLIERQAAIDVLQTYYYDKDSVIYKNGYAYIRYDQALQLIEKLPSTEPEIIRCKDCKYAHMTYNGECKYCDIWFPDEKTYMSGNHYCGSAERREE